MAQFDGSKMKNVQKIHRVLYAIGLGPLIGRIVLRHPRMIGLIMEKAHGLPRHPSREQLEGLAEEEALVIVHPKGRLKSPLPLQSRPSSAGNQSTKVDFAGVGAT